MTIHAFHPRDNTRPHAFPRHWLAGMCLLLPSVGAVAVEAPTLQLFPTTVLEDIKHTGSVAKAMESGLQGIIARLDQQQRLYRDSKCDGAQGDPGCEKITRQIGATYVEMLNAMGDQLPEMERAVQSTRISLERRLRTELGRKMSPRDLQDLLLGKSNAQGRAGDTRPALRGRSGMRLSDRFRQYYQLVANAHSQDSSLAVVASDIYLDMEEASELIARTRDEIARATLMEQLNQSFGTITPAMQEVVAGVKSILFGDQQETPIAGPPPVPTEPVYESPLAM